MIHPFRVPTPTEIDRCLPTAAIDLSGAFSDPAPNGTGYAHCSWMGSREVSEDVTQAQAVSRLCEYVTKVKQSNARAMNLILEAPLSYCFDGAHGGGTSLNARLRAPELRSNYTQFESRSKTDRPWTLNAGSSTALAAILFLRQLKSALPEGIEINLFEGFWSWSKKPGKHHKVASSLVTALLRDPSERPPLVVSLPAGDSQFHYQTILDVVFPQANQATSPPLIVFGDQWLAKAYSHSAASSSLITDH